MKRYPIPGMETRKETIVSNSRFIATIAPAFSVLEARTFENRIKKEFRDASHNVPAFIIGYGSSVITHCKDDGEPSGTAGRPALSVLQGSGLGDAVVVVTRYFGGTKLGKGGLVRAYGNAVRAVLDNLPLAQKVPTHTVRLIIPYSHLERVRKLIKTHQGTVIEEEFTADITQTCQFALEDFTKFQESLGEMTHGTLQAEIIETNPDTIIPCGFFQTRKEVK